MNITSEIKIGHCHFIKNSEIVLAFIIYNYVLTQILIVISDGKVVLHSLRQKILGFQEMALLVKIYILYNSKFNLTSKFFGKDAVIINRVHRTYSVCHSA